MPALAQVNPNLVRAACFEPTLDEGIRVADSLYRHDMCYRVLSVGSAVWPHEAASNAIASIADHPRVDLHRCGNCSVNDGPIHPFHLVFGEASNEFLLGPRGSCK